CPWAPPLLQLAVLAVFSLFLIDGHAQVLLQQHPPSVTQMRFKTVSIQCKVEGIHNFQAAYIHWYRQLPAGAPERILYMSGYSPTFDDSIDRMKFQAQKNPSNCVLTIKKATRRDTGTYYCAYWYNRGYTALRRKRYAMQKGIWHSEPQAMNSHHMKILLYPPFSGDSLQQDRKFLLITSFSPSCLEMASSTSCSITFPGTEVRLTGL
uniref:Ig-like domain-containing protein n=1 Tax=Coturnix japonica TaxID=93934 RepID=A0A8C2T4M0_COTJA